MYRLEGHMVCIEEEGIWEKNTVDRGGKCWVFEVKENPLMFFR